TGWIGLIDAGIMGALGAGDLSARVIFAIGGFVLIMTALAMRPWIGRAGSIGFAMLLALSPSITWFSRAGLTEVPALAVALIVITLFLAISRRPNIGLAIILGAAIGFGLSSNPRNLIVAIIFILALIIIGLTQTATVDNAHVRARIWWKRRALMMLTTVVVAIGVWATLATDFFTRRFFPTVYAALVSNWAATSNSFASSIGLYLPSFAFYEFFILLLAIVGLLAIISMRIRSQFAAFVLIWTVLATGFFLLTPAAAPMRILEILVPGALLGAFGLDWMHHTRMWPILRYPVYILALITIYVSIMANFFVIAPNSTRQFSRRALLFWSVPAATLAVRANCDSAIASLKGKNATVYSAADFPVLRWYLRELAPAPDAGHAGIIVGAKAPDTWPIAAKRQFKLDEQWKPALTGLTFPAAIRFLFTSHAWSHGNSRSITLLTRAALSSAPTTIYAPPSPAPGLTPPQAPPAPANSAPPSATPTPNVSPPIPGTI
ncbi:MAG: hypothetical protein ACREP6_10705, partial [Candidatus Binataceae bacterium]